jgi:predicted ATPase with chaperone activity
MKREKGKKKKYKRKCSVQIRERIKKERKKRKRKRKERGGETNTDTQTDKPTILYEYIPLCKQKTKLSQNCQKSQKLSKCDKILSLYDSF